MNASYLEERDNRTSPVPGDDLSEQEPDPSVSDAGYRDGLQRVREDLGSLLVRLGTKGERRPGLGMGQLTHAPMMQ